MEPFRNSNISDFNASAMNLEEMLKKVQYSAYGKSTRQILYDCAYSIYRECFGDPDKIDFTEILSVNCKHLNTLMVNESLQSPQDVPVTPPDTATSNHNSLQLTNSALEMFYQTDSSNGLPSGDQNRAVRESLHSQQNHMAFSSTSSLKLPNTSNAPPSPVCCQSHNNNTDETKTLKQDASLDSMEPSPSCNTCGNMPCHARPRPLECTVCDKTFLQSGNLHRHERIHTGSRSFQCNICSKVFSNSRSLRVHERIHTGFKPYKCQICDKSFSQDGSLRRHGRSHTKSKPFKCKFCPRDFSREDAAHVHERIHTGTKPFKCKFCTKTFCQSSSLQVHERNHTGFKPFSCKFCSKTFSSSGHLQVHERAHTGSKPFKCEFCTKAFCQSSHLRVHERIHTGSKPFSCKFCTKAFSHSFSLQRHERIHDRFKTA